MEEKPPHPQPDKKKNICKAPLLLFRLRLQVKDCCVVQVNCYMSSLPNVQPFVEIMNKMTKMEIM